MHAIHKSMMDINTNKREVNHFSFIWLDIIITLFQHKFQTVFLIIISTKFYIDNTERKDNYYMCFKV